jgi:nucleoside-diphosphate-sugar epimerase
MRILITGGTGFVGKPTAERLQRRGHKLMLLVRDSRDKNIFASKRNLHFIKGDLSEINRLAGSIRKFKADAALHLAWEGIPDYGAAMSAKNLIFSINLISLLAKLGYKKIICAGSCWEYGAKSGKIDEEFLPRITNAFAAAKDAIHNLGSYLAQERNVDFVWARIFYSYGPRQKPSSLVPHLIGRYSKGANPEIKNPKGGNDFVYVDDVARALVAILEKHKNRQSRTYNIGSGRLTGVGEIVRKIYGAGFKNLAVRPVGFYADISRIKKEIGWMPKIKLGEGIKKTVEYYCK